MMKALPLAIENFPDLIRQGGYYVDKTAFIQPLMTEGKTVRLITRPHCFGKTLFMDMLKSFLQIDWQHPRSAEGHQTFFAGLKVTDDPDFCRRFMGQYPVLCFSFHGIEGADYEKAGRTFAAMLETRVAPHRFLLESPKLDDGDKAALQKLLTPGCVKRRPPEEVAEDFLRPLTVALTKHFGNQVVILIDDFDVPLVKAVESGYGEAMVNLIRAFLGPVLKSSSEGKSGATASVHKVILTGCFPVKMESVFAGITDFDVNTAVSDDEALSGVMGFDEAEVKALLTHCGLSERLIDVRQRYDGYRLAGRVVYCPRDVLNFADKVMRSGDPAHYLPENNWADASSNDVMDEFLGVLSSEDADRIETLAAGGDADITIHEAIIDGDTASHEPQDYWTWLLHDGYLTVVKRLPHPNTYRVTIADEEIREVFIYRVKARYSKVNREFVTHGRDFVKAATEGDRDAMAGVLVPLLANYVSVPDMVLKTPAANDGPGVLTELLTASGFAKDLHTDAEAGEGSQGFIFTYGAGSKRVGIVIEMMHSEKLDNLKGGADAALRAIKAWGRTEYLDRLRCGRQYVYGIAFCRRDCALVGGERRTLTQPQK